MACHVANFWHSIIHYPFLNAHLFIHWLIFNFNLRASRSLCILPNPSPYITYLLGKWSLVELPANLCGERFENFNVISYLTFIRNRHMQARTDVTRDTCFRYENRVSRVVETTVCRHGRRAWSHPVFFSFKSSSELPLITPLSTLSALCVVPSSLFSMIIFS